MSKLITTITNGNAKVKLYNDGTRVIDYENNLTLDYPLNVDVRLSNQCAFGINPKTGKAVCDFCHESATTDGKHGNLDILYNVLCELPKGTEIAIGINNFENNIITFLTKLSNSGYIINTTINHGHLIKYYSKIKYLINEKIIYGLGISYRSNFKDIPQYFLDYEHTVLHVIAGIDDITNILTLSNKVNKILVLGEKDFGLNSGKVNLESKSHKLWLRLILNVINNFGITSFDNLALQQLNIKRFLDTDKWDSFYQAEHSIYIDAVKEAFAPSSRSGKFINWDVGIKKYFKEVNNG